MAEANGTGRLERIEKILERLAAAQDEFRQDMRQLLTAQVLQKDEIDKLWNTVREQTKQLTEHTKQLELQREKDKLLDERVDKLVSAIGEYLRRQQNGNA